MGDGEKKSSIWFKNAVQIHGYLTSEIGAEYVWGDRQVAVKQGLVFRVAQKTVYNHIDSALLKSRRGVGGFAKRTVDQYARRELGDKVLAGDKGELPDKGDESEGETELARERRTKADAEVKEVDAQLKRLRLQKELGEVVSLHMVERELGERQQAWKLFMGSFMRDHKAEILSVLGGDLAVAREIISLVGGDEDRAEALSGWMFARSPVLLDLFNRHMVEGLNVFAMGGWFTEDIREAWNKLAVEAARRSREHAAEFLELVGGDQARLDKALALFEVRPREAAE